MSLFSNDQKPLAEQLRPQTLAEVVGQEHVLGAEGALGRSLPSGRLSSLIFWGPAGCGKTTIARLLANHVELEFCQVQAVFSGVAELKKIFEAARKNREAGRGTLLFVDEIHRFNRAQQDAFLPVVEDGTIVLVGATTENPSFELNAALLSRCQVLILKRLEDEALEALLERAEKYLGREFRFEEGVRQQLFAMADGDGRYFLNRLQALSEAFMGDKALSSKDLEEVFRKRPQTYDKDRDGHYNLISALHKSLRSSDTDAALYWLARMLAGGEDPHFILRRLVRFASEDIGLADPQALIQALAAWEAYDKLGSPEGELMLAQAVVYLGTAPKSNALYMGMKQAQAAAHRTGSVAPPPHILNAPTKLMKNIGYGKDYAYDHDDPDGFSGQNCFPESLERQQFYQPINRGFEREITKRLSYWNGLRLKKQGNTA